MKIQITNTFRNHEYWRSWHLWIDGVWTIYEVYLDQQKQWKTRLCDATRIHMVPAKLTLGDNPEKTIRQFYQLLMLQ
jgi:hypothetical protein